ncbi:hypothetical protein HPP92_013640 [Vanilla planifolia]|uniref:Bifunctional inhibitor/plant lipid transfer protein/seed storage helical domain-containing protein n=1 Tax=Vanilla planifolia TaxID=51239 RepID=A0A835UV01_VANPL|nr:hypothetical protein HPP92_013640 [Vanilla planifolia]
MAQKPTWTTTFALAMTLALLLSAVWAADTWKLCNMTQEGLAACRPAISEPAQKGASPPGPTDACCAALGNADLACLCGYKNSGLLSYFGIDPDLAMQLPVKCNLPAPAKC